MQVRHECHFEIAGFDCRNFSVESSGLGAAHNAGSEINKISGVANNNGSRGARTFGVGHREAPGKSPARLTPTLTRAAVTLNCAAIRVPPPIESSPNVDG